MRAPPGLHVRDIKVEGVGPWLWVETDMWAWNHPGPEFAPLRDLVLANTPEPKVIVQAGGCMGMYPRLLSELFETVYTFEPDPVNFYCLTANCPSERIVKVQAALSDRAGVGSLDVAPSFNAGMFKVGDAPGATLVLRLDDLRLPRLDALQLDCEGHEDRIIQGGMGTIRACLPVIVVEKPGAALRELLAGLGYKEVGHTGTLPDVAFSARQ